jgi:hypothetical protein
MTDLMIDHVCGGGVTDLVFFSRLIWCLVVCVAIRDPGACAGGDDAGGGLRPGRRGVPPTLRLRTARERTRGRRKAPPRTRPHLWWVGRGIIIIIIIIIRSTATA